VNAADVEAALARLRDARRPLLERSARDVQRALADVLDAWSAPDSAWRKELATALPAATGFSPEVVREGLARGLAPYTGAALLDLVRDELGDDDDAWDGFETTASVLAGAIPLPTFVAIVAPLALRSPVLVKPSAHDAITARLVTRSIAERDALLGTCIEVADFHRDDAAALDALCQAPCVAAMGSDEAIAALRVRVAPQQRFAASGHRFSLALVGPGATSGPKLDAVAAGLALDTALWDQLGCLSPVSVWVADPDAGAAARVAEALAHALDDAERTLPRGRVDAGAAAAIARERAEAEMRVATNAARAVLASQGTEWTVVCEATSEPRPSPLHRFLRVHAVADAGAAMAALAPQRRWLASVALAGFGDASASLVGALRELGASRVCSPGELQTPALAWPRDGEPVLRRLARRTR
jgi:hypothetical protein